LISASLKGDCCKLLRQMVWPGRAAALKNEADCPNFELEGLLEI
jgi:hypothetical protein